MMTKEHVQILGALNHCPKDLEGMTAIDICVRAKHASLCQCRVFDLLADLQAWGLVYMNDPSSGQVARRPCLKGGRKLFTLSSLGRVCITGRPS